MKDSVRSFAGRPSATHPFHNLSRDRLLRIRQDLVLSTGNLPLSPEGMEFLQERAPMTHRELKLIDDLLARVETVKGEPDLKGLNYPELRSLYHTIKCTIHSFAYGAETVKNGDYQRMLAYKERVWAEILLRDPAARRIDTTPIR